MSESATIPHVTTDVTDESALERLFQPPSEIVLDLEWVERYEALVRRLQRDASGLPMDMAQKMLIERQASTYIRLLWYQTNGGMSERQLTEMNKLYLAYTAQFQKVLQASDEVLRQDMVNKFSEIVQEIPKLIQDDEDRKRVFNFIREEFHSLGF